MKQRGQLVRIREAVAKKITAVQLLQSIQQTRILTKSEALDIVLNQFLSNQQATQE